MKLLSLSQFHAPKSVKHFNYKATAPLGFEKHLCFFWKKISVASKWLQSTG